MADNINFNSNSPGIPKRVLGRTKLSVSILGFGCTQVKNKAVYQRAIELGVNYFHMGYRDIFNIVWSMTPEAKEEFIPILRELATGCIPYSF